MFKEYGIEYIYIGQNQGVVNAPGPAILNPHQLEIDSRFKLIYHEDRVWVFKIIFPPSL
jgi:hypothetical protein